MPRIVAAVTGSLLRSFIPEKISALRLMSTLDGAIIGVRF
jgi:hypothetical protein